VDIDGVRELAKLMQENDDLINEFDQKNPFSKRVFAAHSESDLTADISGIEKLQKYRIAIGSSFVACLKPWGYLTSVWSSKIPWRCPTIPVGQNG